MTKMRHQIGRQGISILSRKSNSSEAVHFSRECRLANLSAANVLLYSSTERAFQNEAVRYNPYSRFSGFLQLLWSVGWLSGHEDVFKKPKGPDPSSEKGRGKENQFRLLTQTG